MKGNLKTLQQRIRTVASTKKVTNVMKMIAASRFKIFHKMLIDAQKYDAQILKMISRYFVVSKNFTSSFNIKLTEKRKSGKTLLICISSDRSLCGNFNTSIVNYVNFFLEKKTEDEIEIIAIGAKINKFLKSKWPNIKCESYTGINVKEVEYANLSSIINKIVDMFLNEDIQSVQMIFSRFINSVKNIMTCEQLLPLYFPNDDELNENDIEEYEPNAEVIIDKLVMWFIRGRFYLNVLHSHTGEQCTRMMAMDNATRNAEEIGANLLLTRNRIRQAGITNELLEIISGAESMKKN